MGGEEHFERGEAGMIIQLNNNIFLTDRVDKKLIWDINYARHKTHKWKSMNFTIAKFVFVITN